MTTTQLIAILTILNIMNLASIEKAILDISPGARTMIEGVWIEHRVELVDSLGPKHVYERSIYCVDGTEWEQASSAAYRLAETVVAKETATR